MKIRFLKTIAVDVETRYDDEIYSKSFRKWDVIEVKDIFFSKNCATIQTEKDEYLMNVPNVAFEKLVEEYRKFVL